MYFDVNMLLYILLSWFVGDITKSNVMKLVVKWRRPKRRKGGSTVIDWHTALVYQCLLPEIVDERPRPVNWYHTASL